MRTEIVGTTLPRLEVYLEPGETLISEAGQAAWLDAPIMMRTAATGIGGAGGGLKGAMHVAKRAVGGSSIFMSEYSAEGGTGHIAFGTKVPGEILPMQSVEGKAHMVHSYGFIAGESTISVSAGLQKKLGAGVLGGAGLVLQKIEGNGQWWAELSGEIKEMELPEGYKLRVHPGHLGMFEDSISLNLVTIKGIKNKFFGQGLFFAELTGPGKVWLQSLSMASLAESLQPYLSSGDGGGGIGSTVGNIIGS
jgi:uncharacterized protein (TIGR00266 family)